MSSVIAAAKRPQRGRQIAFIELDGGVGEDY
jgi:hypothetical protein